jgi:hypothetical protein
MESFIAVHEIKLRYFRWYTSRISSAVYDLLTQQHQKSKLLPTRIFKNITFLLGKDSNKQLKCGA